MSGNPCGEPAPEWRDLDIWRAELRRKPPPELAAAARTCGAGP